MATITGFGWIDEIKSIPGLKLSLYDTSDAAIRDLLAGRIDALFADPPLVQYAISKNHETYIRRKNLESHLPTFVDELYQVVSIANKATEKSGHVLNRIVGF